MAQADTIETIERPAAAPHADSTHPDVISQAELDSTQVSRSVAKAMSLLFLVLAGAVLVLDTIIQQSRDGRVKAADLFQPAADAVATGSLRALSPLGSPEFLRSYEESLADHSPSRQFFQPRLQNVLSGAMGFGNDKGVIGRDGWLFYQSGIDYLTGPGILDAAHLRLRTQKMANKGDRDPNPDPRPAILRFNDDCRKAGVHLIVAPMPDKAQLQPAQLTRRMEFDAPMPPPNNRDFAQFVRELRQRGVDVFDPTPAQLRPGDIRYLIQDTHWTPPFMQQVAGDLADYIRRTVDLPPRQMRTQTKTLPVARLGDIVGMLKLSADQSIYRPQEVIVEQVQDSEGRPWHSDPSADVVLLGDSFTNVFSDGEGGDGLGWGRSAGLAPHLSRFLGRPIDVIARNGSGASVTRAELARRPDPLGGKKVVIWEFAIRELACESWKIIPIQAKAPAAPPVADELVVQAELLTSVPPEARKTEVYVNALMVLKMRVLSVEKGRHQGTMVLVKLPSILGRQVQPSTQMRVGEVYRLALRPQGPPEHEATQVVDETGEFRLAPFWVQRFEKLR